MEDQALSDSFRLMFQVSTGDPSSYWRFTQKLRPYLKQVVRSQLQGKFPRKIDESDVVQAALIRAVQSIDKFEGESKLEWKAWLSVICQNESRNAIRFWLRHRRDVNAEQELIHSGSLIGNNTSIGVQFDKQNRIDKMLHGISKLDKDQQLLVQWRHFDDLSHKEIAVKLGVSVEAARKRWQSTIIKLKKILVEVDGDENC